MRWLVQKLAELKGRQGFLWGRRGLDSEKNVLRGGQGGIGDSMNLGNQKSGVLG